MKIQFYTNHDIFDYNYICCFYNLKNQYVFLSKKVCFSSFCLLDEKECKRTWDIEYNKSTILRSIVRNPYERLESLYKDKLIFNVDKNKIQNTQTEIIKKFGEDKFFNKQISFEEFIFSLSELISGECHFYPQNSYIPDFVDYVHHIENKVEIDYIFSLFNSDRIFDNWTPKIDLHWTDGMRKLVNELYYEDFKRFNYSFYKQ